MARRSNKGRSNGTSAPAKVKIRDEIAELAVPIETLRPHPSNPRNGDTDLIVTSLRKHGQYRPIVVRKSTGEILAGNHTYAAAMELGWNVIAATFVDVDDQQALQILLMDNRSADKARYDDGQLAAVLKMLDAEGALEGTGYDDDDLAKLLNRVEPPEGDDESGAIPDTWQILVSCRDENQQRTLLERFAEEGVAAKPLIG